MKFSKIGIKEKIETVHQKESDAETKTAKTAYEIYKSLSLIQEPEDSDLAVIYYVSGSCARSVSNIHRCSSCKEILTKNKAAVEFETEDVPQTNDK